MKLCFDLICDEALLFDRVAAHLMQEHAICASGFTMGNRWLREIKGITRTYPFSLTTHTATRADLNHLTAQYDDYDPSYFLTSDRFLPEFHDRKKQRHFLVSLFHFFEELINNDKPDILVTTGVAYAYNLVALAVCSKLGVRQLSLYSTRQPQPGFTYSSGNGGHWDLFERDYYLELNSLKLSATSKVIPQAETPSISAQDRSAPFYMSFGRQSGNLTWTSISEFFRRLYYWHVERWGAPEEDYITRHPTWYARRDLSRIVRRIIQNYTIHFDKVDIDDRYYLYPLHLQPEASTLILAKTYVNQLDTVRNIASVLPLDSMLYVKEHPAAYGRRTNDFYETLQKIHNVKILSPYESGMTLIRNSKGVIVLSGTMGWEALQAQVPVFVLGDVFYDRVFGANKVRNFDALRESIRSPETPNAQSNLAALRAIQKCGELGLFDVTKLDSKSLVLAPTNISLIAAGLIKLINREI